MSYKLNNEALFKLSHPNNRHVLDELGEEMGVHRDSVTRWIRLNSKNNPLTTICALEILAGNLNFKAYHEMLEAI